MTDKTASEQAPEAIQRMQALKLVLEAAAAGEAPSSGDFDPQIEQILDLVCDGLAGVDAGDMRHALCGPSGRPPDELALAHGQFSPGPDAADGIASVLDQISSANWQHTNGVFMLATAASDTKLSQIRELCQAIRARLPKDGMLIFGTATDARMTAGLCSVAVLAAKWRG